MIRNRDTSRRPCHTVLARKNALFVVGFYPESLTGRRRLGGPDYYAVQVGHHGVREYTRGRFYQYVLRQYGWM
jgi:hypothetical protein